jgi:cytochrome c-type biogenesis protein CcmH/NrfG
VIEMHKPKAERLRELDELMKSGLISEQEFKQAREKIISE